MDDLPLRGTVTALPDFCFVDYSVDEVADGDPAVGEPLHPAAALIASFELAGLGDVGRRVVDRVTTAFGPDRTVWGIKSRGGRIHWELYLYNPPRTVPVAPDALAAALSGEVDLVVPASVDDAPDAYSVDLGPDVLVGARVDAVHVYVANSGARAKGGMSYRYDSGGATLENSYYVYEIPHDIEALGRKLAESVHLDTAMLGTAPYAEALSEAPLVHVANKPRCDGLYFSLLRPDVAVAMLPVLGFPSEFVGSIVDLVPRLGGLRFDVGVDVRAGAVVGGALFVPR